MLFALMPEAPECSGRTKKYGPDQGPVFIYIAALPFCRPKAGMLKEIHCLVLNFRQEMVCHPADTETEKVLVEPLLSKDSRNY